MGKFKKGDRVKAVVGGVDYKAGDEFVLTRDGNGKSVYFVDNAGDERTRPQEEVELLPVAEATGMTQDEIGKAREIPGMKSNTTTRTPLTIEAGKYYRTRDGRKVGPMSKGCLGSFPWLGKSQSSGIQCYRNDGSWSLDVGEPDHHDLIAEWVDEPTSETTAAPISVKIMDERMFVQHGVIKLPTIKSPSIVARLDNGQPMPAVLPLVHDTKDDAEKEAKRLSEKHRGKEFGVFTLTAKHQAEAIYEHEWQRLAANGNKIGAIKAIRKLTGFGRKAAKDGLEDWLSRNAA